MMVQINIRHHYINDSDSYIIQSLLVGKVTCWLVSWLSKILRNVAALASLSPLTIIPASLVIMRHKWERRWLVLNLLSCLDREGIVKVYLHEIYMGSEYHRLLCVARVEPLLQCNPIDLKGAHTHTSFLHFQTKTEFWHVLSVCTLLSDVCFRCQW